MSFIHGCPEDCLRLRPPLAGLLVLQVTLIYPSMLAHTFIAHNDAKVHYPPIYKVDPFSI